MTRIRRFQPAKAFFMATGRAATCRGCEKIRRAVHDFSAPGTPIATFFPGLADSERWLRVRKIATLAKSIGFRLLLPLCATVAAVLAVHAALSFRSTQDHFLRFVRADARRCGELIERATHDGMLLNRLDQVQATFERLADGSDIAGVRCYNKEGVVVLSAQRGEIGRRIDMESATCRSCHGPERVKSAAVVERSRMAHKPGGPDVLHHLKVIPNETSCSTAACHAHPEDRKVLGVLDVEMSMAPLDATIRAAQGHLVWTTVALLAVIAVVAALFVTRFVHRPVKQLHDGTLRIASGDLDTRIEVRGEDELSRLGLAFNAMADDLRAARRDVTEWSRTLEHKVAEKTEELRRAQQQVLHMEKMASLGKLSASVAHELNNPLAGMLTYARLIKRGIHEHPLSSESLEELDRYLGVVEQECRRCGEIVKNLLIFSRRGAMNMTRVDLRAVAEKSMLLVRHHLEIRGVRLRCDASDERIEWVADADQIAQALLALFVNAAEAMDAVPRERRELLVRLRADDANVRIDVADTGPGIPPDVLPHIFEPFFSTKQKESGVGLGLAVVFGIVHRHGGSIDVRSQRGEGTTFFLCLPRSGPPPGANWDAAAEVPAETPRAAVEMGALSP